MPTRTIVRSSPVVRSARVAQIEGMFDVPPSERSGQEWHVNLPLDEQPWYIGLIVGPSGCGKSTIAREFFGDAVCQGFDWSSNRSLLDAFPAEMGIKDISALLSSVGFSSPPLWLRPFGVLSTGQQMRVTVARLLAEQKDLAVMDEFTSVVDRTVAQIGSAAIAKAVRARGQRFVAVTCHEDVAEWLQPDWVYQPATNIFQWRLLQRKPRINLQFGRISSSAWATFRQYHYLDTNLHKAAQCFAMYFRDRPVAFCAVLPFPHATRKNTWREHRLVCLPDYQGVGIGNMLSATVGAMLKGIGISYISSTGNPAMIDHRNRSPNWRMFRAPSFSQVGRKQGAIGAIGSRILTQSRPWRGVGDRLTASFEFVGDAMEQSLAQSIWRDGKKP